MSTSSQDKSVVFSLLGMVKGGQGKGVSTLTRWKSLVLAIEPDYTEPHIVNSVSVTIARTD